MSEPKLIVVRKPRPNSEVAAAICEYLKGHPHEHTVTEISEALDVDVEQVVVILNNYEPQPDGSVKQVKAGQGGGWLPEHIAREYRTTEGE